MAVPSVTITAKLESISGGNDPGKLVFTLCNYGDGVIPEVSGTSILSDVVVTAQAAADGTLSIALWNNSNITPDTTFYEVQVWNADSAGPVFTACYLLNTDGTFDLSTLTPLDVTGVNPILYREGPQGIQGIQGEVGPAGPDGSIGPQGETGPQGPRGLAGGSMNWLAEYDQTVNYILDDGVTYLGSSYVSLGDSINVTPGTDPTVWQLNAQKGDTGDTGPAGADGVAGVEGPMGPAGIDGRDGVPGVPGADGAAGTSGTSRTPIKIFADYTAVAGDIVITDSTLGDIIVTLPSAVADGVIDVKKMVQANLVTVAAPSGKTLEGDPTMILTNEGDDITCGPDGTDNWIAI